MAAGFCFNADDIDLATVFIATIAHHLTIIRDDDSEQPGMWQ
jgi:hypothetical protein